MKYRKGDQFGRFIVIESIAMNVKGGQFAMRTQIKATRLSGRLCVFGLMTFLIGSFIGCTGEQPADNVEPGKKAISSPDQNHESVNHESVMDESVKDDTTKKGTMKKGTMKKDTMKKGMMKKGMMKKGMMKKDMMKKDMMKKDSKKTNSGATLP